MSQPATSTPSGAQTIDHFGADRLSLDEADPVRPDAECCGARARHEQLQELLDDVYLLTDREGVIREANAAVSALVGIARVYVVGKPVWAFVHRADQPGLAAWLAGLDGATPARPATWRGRLRARRPGEAQHVVARVSPLVDAGGAADGLQWLIRDVSAERARADRLRALERELEGRVRARTAELDALVRVQAARLDQLAPPA